MTAARAAGRADREPAGGAEAAGLRLTIYGVALGIAFALCLVAQGPGQGAAFWACALAAGAALATGIRGFGPPFRAGVCGALALALAIPVVPEWWQRAAAGPLMEAVPLWPQILVALFASRVLTEEADLRYARFWRAPLDASSAVQLQSATAAVALGACFTFAFYQALWWAAPGRVAGATMGAIVMNALNGQTPVHRGILFLFFVILAFALDAALHYRRDRAALLAFQRALRAERRRGPVPDRAALRALLSALSREEPQTRTAQLLHDAFDALDPQPSGGRVLAASAFGAFHLASRRFIRGLLPFLPLLGFFGTVVGLATAMAALPTSAGAGGSIDISGSLAGLAVKFETTLLGIMASMVASFILGLIERCETELAAACALLVGAAEDGDAA